MHGKSISVLFFVLGIFCMMLFLPPFFRHIINLGNLTGMAVSLLFLAYGIFFTKINGIFISLWNRRLGKALIILGGFSCIVILVLVVILTVCMIGGALNKPPENTDAIVLGCAVHGKRPSLMLSKRLEAALTYLEENPYAHAVLSGGKGPGEEITEAQCMFEYLTAHGIQKSRLHKEERSEDTAENIKYSRALLQEFRQGSEVVVITNGFHQYRAGLLAKKAGLTPYSVSGKTVFYLLPTYYVRELYAILWQWISPFLH